MKLRFNLQPTRRQLLTALGAGAVSATTTFPAFGQSTAPKKVLVIGGGMAGATVAKYLRLWSNKTVDVTIVEPSSTYVSNIMSNLVVTGQYAASILNYTWATLKSSYGVKVTQGTVTGVTKSTLYPGMWDVSLKGVASPVTVDKVVVAPGIDFHPVVNLAGTSVPVLHAWKAGNQTTQLGSLLKSLPVGGTIVMTIPGKPYRCPPGPYERACVIADYLKRNNPTAKIVVLDHNPGVVAEPENFYAAFALYPDNLQYVPYSTLVKIDPKAFVTVDGVSLAKSGTVYVQNSVTGLTETYKGDLLNIIPKQMAGKIAQDLLLCDAPGGFAPVNGASFESSLPGMSGIHIIGDASKTALPKAGHVGNQGAKICADAILRSFIGWTTPYPTLTANSACFSPISNTMASWLTAVYQYNSVSNTYVISDDVKPTSLATEANGFSTGNFTKMYTWYKTLMAETFA